MNLEKISIVPVGDKFRRFKKAINELPLKGGANYESVMEGKLLTEENGVSGEVILLCPKEEVKNLRFSFDLSSLPGNYRTEYFFGDLKETPIVIITELDSIKGMKCSIKRRYYLYSKRLKEFFP